MRAQSWIAGAAIVASISAALAADVAGRRVWRVEPDITVEQTASDLRAWSDRDPNTPLFSVAALLAAEKKKFDESARELARDLADVDLEGRYTTFEQEATFEVLSVVGPLLTYRESGGGYSPGAAHPTRYDVLHVLDLTRQAARPTLLDYFPEKQVLAALKADRWVRKFADPEGGFAGASSLEELVQALDSEWARENGEEGDCAFDVSFSRDGLVEQFYFHHLEGRRVAVRIEVGPGSEWCNRLGGTQTIGLLLPIPDKLREPLRRAESGEAGFLAATPSAAGRPRYSEHWEVDVATLIER